MDCRYDVQIVTLARLKNKPKIAATEPSEKTEFGSFLD